MRKLKLAKGFSVGLFLSLVLLGAQKADAMVIGYYNDTRSFEGFDDVYLDEAANLLRAQGHTLVSTGIVDNSFLDSVDAFYAGLVILMRPSEIDALDDFVNTDGGFLFIQQDHSNGYWFNAANALLANWGIHTEGLYQNDDAHVVVSDTDWVTDPNLITSPSGSAHSVIDVMPDGFEVLVEDDLGGAVLGVFDAGAGRSSDVVIASDVNLWTDFTNPDNRLLWENIWSVADLQLAPPTGAGGGSTDGSVSVSEPNGLGLFLVGLLVLMFKRGRLSKN